MDTRLTTTHDIRRLLVAAIVALVLVMALGATSASAAKAATCSVTNTDSGRTYTRLQQAVDAAKRGDHLTVRGTCMGKTVMDKKLVIEGVKTRTSGTPTLSGDRRVRVVDIAKGVRVKMVRLVISNGRARSGAASSTRGA